MNSIKLATPILAIGLLLGACNQSTNDYSDAKATFNTMEDSVSYSIGFQNGENYANQGLTDLDIQNFLAGLNDGLQGNDSKVEEADLQDLFQRFSAYLKDKILSDNAEEQEAFLAENRTKDGVMETESGLQYKILEEGTGEIPTPQDTVRVHYTGRLVDGTVFDTSVKNVAMDEGVYNPQREPYEPAEFLLGAVIPGWTEGVGLMKEGAKYELYIPSDLAYGKNPRPGGVIQPNDMLIFEVELIEIK